MRPTKRAEFKLKQGRSSAEGERSQPVCSVIYQNVYLIRLINVSGFLSNYMPLIYQPASRWWIPLKLTEEKHRSKISPFPLLWMLYITTSTPAPITNSQRSCDLPVNVPALTPTTPTTSESTSTLTTLVESPSQEGVAVKPRRIRQ